MDAEGTLKISILSFARLTASLSSTTQLSALTDDAISARYFSPELLEDGARPTPESDMWAFGCVAFWVNGIAAELYNFTHYFLCRCTQTWSRIPLSNGSISLSQAS